MNYPKKTKILSVAECHNCIFLKKSNKIFSVKYFVVIIFFLVTCVIVQDVIFIANQINQTSENLKGLLKKDLFFGKKSREKNLNIYCSIPLCSLAKNETNSTTITVRLITGTILKAKVDENTRVGDVLALSVKFLGIFYSKYSSPHYMITVPWTSLQLQLAS